MPGTPQAIAATRTKSPTRTTPRGLPGRNSWPGWGRSFHSSARTAGATSGSSRSSPSRARSVRFSHTSANRSSHHRSQPPAAHPPTGASSSRRMTTATSSNRRLPGCPRSTSTASERYRPRAAEAPGKTNWDAVCADARKTPPKWVQGVLAKHHRTVDTPKCRCSRTVRQLEDRCRSAIGRIILHRPDCPSLAGLPCFVGSVSAAKARGRSEIW